MEITRSGSVIARTKRHTDADLVPLVFVRDCGCFLSFFSVRGVKYATIVFICCGVWRVLFYFSVQGIMQRLLCLCMLAWECASLFLGLSSYASQVHGSRC